MSKIKKSSKAEKAVDPLEALQAQVPLRKGREPCCQTYKGLAQRLGQRCEQEKSRIG
jgi:hypothetical protein